MSNITVDDLSKLMKIDSLKFIKILNDANIIKNSIYDEISNDEKSLLLTHLGVINKSSLFIKKKSVQQLSVNGNKKINIEVRKKKIFTIPNIYHKDNVNTSNINNDIVNTSKNDLINNSNKNIHNNVEVHDNCIVNANKLINKNSTIHDNNSKNINNNSINEVNLKEENNSNNSFLNTSIIDDSIHNDNKKLIMNKNNDINQDKLKNKKVNFNSDFNIIEKPSSNFHLSVKHKSENKNIKNISINKYTKNIIKPYSEKEDYNQNIKKQKKDNKNINKNKVFSKSNNVNDYLDDDINNNYFKEKKNTKNNKHHSFIKPTFIKTKKIILHENMTVSVLAKKMSIKSSEIITYLFNMGVVKTINNSLDLDTSILILESFGYTYEIYKEKEIDDSIFDKKDKVYKLLSRHPVVTIIGHVDHGKTTLLDYIRKTNVSQKEIGGITQHIGSYVVDTKYGKITFLDTPGHQAFGNIRSKGIQVADIAILLISIDDGVMPQTLESIKYARSFNTPIIVAINKIDKDYSQTNFDKINKDLSQYNLISEDWGGDTMLIPLSAKTGMGVDKLLESITAQSEILQLQTNHEGNAKGIIIEYYLDKGKGVVITVLITSGILKVGDIILCGVKYGKVKCIIDSYGQYIKNSLPSYPVKIVGLSGIPNIGENMFVVDNEKIAKELSYSRIEHDKKVKINKQRKINVNSLNLLDKKINDNNHSVSKLNIIIKGDVKGSVDAIYNSLVQLSSNEVIINIMYCDIGDINSSDINLSITSQSYILGFNVKIDSSCFKHKDYSKVTILLHNIIYELIDNVNNIISKMLEPKNIDQVYGIAEVRNIFNYSKSSIIAGCIVLDGFINRKNNIHIIRKEKIIHKGKIISLKRFKNDVNEVKKGFECGLVVKDFVDIQPGDYIKSISNNSLNYNKENNSVV